MAFGIGKSEQRPEDDEPVLEEQERATSEGDVAEENEGSSRERGPFRPSYVDAMSPEGQEQAPPRAAGDTFFVSILRQGEEELRRFDDPVEAQAFVEGLLSDGVPQDEVTAFSGHRLSLHVSHRPVVKLFSGEE